jgi:glutathione S-transferase
MLELYYAPGTVALASMIALNDAGAPHRLRRVDFATDEQKSEAYLAVNPKARVPTLVGPQGRLTETPAILAFIAQTHPGARLAPAEPFAFARMQAFNCYLCATLHVAHAHRMRGHRWSDDPAAWEAMRRFVPRSVGACWQYVEEHAFAGPFVMGEQYTVADPYLFTMAQWMEADSIDPGRFPKVSAHRAMMAGRPSVREALAVVAG